MIVWGEKSRFKVVFPQQFEPTAHILASSLANEIVTVKSILLFVNYLNFFLFRIKNIFNVLNLDGSMVHVGLVYSAHYSGTYFSLGRYGSGAFAP